MLLGKLLLLVLLSVIFGAFPAALLFVPGPPPHGSWWYPNPDRWDYGFKLRLYAAIDANTPQQPGMRWFVRVIGVIVLAVTLALIWQPFVTG